MLSKVAHLMVVLKILKNCRKPVKTGKTGYFSAFSPVNQFHQAAPSLKLFLNERAQKTTPENGQMPEVDEGGIC